MKTNRPHPDIGLTLLLLAAASVALADFTIGWWTIGGGGTISQGGDFELAGTVGQPAAGTPMTGGDFTVTGGFWNEEIITPPVCHGDSNCDGQINWRDIDFFVAAQNDNVSAWTALHEQVYGAPPSCPFANNDVDGSGSVSWRDIDPFVALQNTTCP